MITTYRRVLTTLAVLALAALGAAFAATPPSEINYQGVLRDLAGNPENGAKDMTFRFYDTDGGVCPAAGGTLLLTDDHLSGSAVNVTNGMFNVLLGTGTITAGSASDLSEVFRDNAAVFLEVEVAGDLLCPRTPIASAPYAINAGKLNGMDASEYIDTSATTHIKSGNLQVSGILTTTSLVRFVNGANMTSLPGSMTIKGDSDTDDLFLFAGSDAGAGGIRAFGDGILYLDGGIGYFSFRNRSGGLDNETASINSLGNMQIDGDLTVTGNDIFFGTGSSITSNTAATQLFAGNADTDDLYLYAGNSLDDGSIALFGDASMELRAGNGLFNFLDGSTGTVTAILNATGDLQIDGDLTVSGGDLLGVSDLDITSDLTVTGGEKFS